MNNFIFILQSVQKKNQEQKMFSSYKKINYSKKEQIETYKNKSSYLKKKLNISKNSYCKQFYVYNK